MAAQAKVSIPPAPKPDQTLHVIASTDELKVSGAGTIDLNVEGGFVAASATANE